MTADEEYAFLSSLPTVESFQPDVLGQFAADIANDPYADRFTVQMPQDKPFLQHWLQRIHLLPDGSYTNYAWDVANRGTTGSSSVAAAVVDNGVNIDHEDLMNNIFRNPLDPVDGADNDGNGKIDDYKGWNLVSGNNNPKPTAFNNDSYGETHGTSIAGIIAGQGNNGIGIAGVSWNSKIVALRIGDNFNNLYSARISNAINAFNHVWYLNNSGANVRAVNASLVYTASEIQGTAGSNPSGINYATPFENAIKALRDQGVFIVAAAGNESKSIDDPNQAIYPAAYSYTNIIGVAMTNETVNTTRLQSKSNYGVTSVDIAAPGGDYEPTTGAVGIFTTRWQGNAPGNQDYGEYVDLIGATPTRAIRGTSYAAPMVVGAITLLASLHPEASLSAIRASLLSAGNMTPLNSSDAGKLANGGGILDVYKALNYMRTQYLGGGYDATAVGDDGAFKRNDVFRIRPKPNVTGVTQVLRRRSDGVDVEVATAENNSSDRIAVFMLKGNDQLTIEAGVNNPIYIRGGSGSDTVIGNDANDTLESASNTRA